MVLLLETWDVTRTRARMIDRQRMQECEIENRRRLSRSQTCHATLSGGCFDRVSTGSSDQVRTRGRRVDFVPQRQLLGSQRRRTRTRTAELAGSSCDPDTGMDDRGRDRLSSRNVHAGIRASPNSASSCPPPRRPEASTRRWSSPGRSPTSRVTARCARTDRSSPAASAPTSTLDRGPRRGRQVGLAILATLRARLGSLDRVGAS